MQPLRTNSTPTPSATDSLASQPSTGTLAAGQRGGALRVEQPRCPRQTTRCASAAWQGEKRPTAATTRLPPTQTPPRSLPRRAAAQQKRCSCARARWLASSTLRSTPAGARSSCCSKASAASRTASRRSRAKITRTKPKNEMRLGRAPFGGQQPSRTRVAAQDGRHGALTHRV